MDEVAALEARIFGSPWSARAFHRLLRRPGYHLAVLKDAGGGVAGYAALSRVLDQGELTNLAVRPELRGRGLGARLLDHVIRCCRRSGVTSLFLEVRESNRVAAGLYATRGFREVGRRRHYYRHPREDARVLMLSIDPPNPPAGGRPPGASGPAG